MLSNTIFYLLGAALGFSSGVVSKTVKAVRESILSTVSAAYGQKPSSTAQALDCTTDPDSADTPHRDVLSPPSGALLIAPEPLGPIPDAKVGPPPRESQARVPAVLVLAAAAPGPSASKSESDGPQAPPKNSIQDKSAPLPSLKIVKASGEEAADNGREKVTITAPETGAPAGPLPPSSCSSALDGSVGGAAVASVLQSMPAAVHPVVTAVEDNGHVHVHEANLALIKGGAATGDVPGSGPVVARKLGLGHRVKKRLANLFKRSK